MFLNFRSGNGCEFENIRLDRSHGTGWLVQDRPLNARARSAAHLARTAKGMNTLAATATIPSARPAIKITTRTCICCAAMPAHTKPKGPAVSRIALSAANIWPDSSGGVCSCNSVCCNGLPAHRHRARCCASRPFWFWTNPPRHLMSPPNSKCKKPSNKSVAGAR
jgi:hypothetical protein